MGRGKVRYAIWAYDHFVINAELLGPSGILKPSARTLGANHEIGGTVELLNYFNCLTFRRSQTNANVARRAV